MKEIQMEEEIRIILEKNKPKRKIKSITSIKEQEETSPNIELIRAVKKESEERVRAALLDGADVHFENDSALFFACSQGSKKLVQVLIESNADVVAKNCKALRRALSGGRAGRTHVIRLLLDNGADIGNNRANVQMMIAVKRDDLNELKIAIDDGADIHFENDSPIYFCSSLGFTPLVQVLINAQADVKANDSKALRVAAKGGHEEVVRLLIEAESDPNGNNGGALRAASFEGYSEIVKLLLDAGVNLEYQQIALDRAKERGHENVIDAFKSSDDLFKWMNEKVHENSVPSTNGSDDVHLY